MSKLQLENTGEDSNDGQDATLEWRIKKGSFFLE
jgi:hypothetical protein